MSAAPARQRMPPREQIEKIFEQAAYMEGTMARLARREGKLQDGATCEQHVGAWQEVAMHAHLRRASADLEWMVREPCGLPC